MLKMTQELDKIITQIILVPNHTVQASKVLPDITILASHNHCHTQITGSHMKHMPHLTIERENGRQMTFKKPKKYFIFFKKKRKTTCV